MYEEYLFAGTTDGVFISANNGETWICVSPGLTDMTVSALAVYGSNLFAGTQSGVWRRSLSEMITSVKGKSNKLLHQYSLYQNYLNPFNPVTTINYEIGKLNKVLLKIYNLSGQELETLVNGYQTAGKYEITWIPKGLPSGIYFYRLQAGEFSETRKLILQK